MRIATWNVNSLRSRIERVEAFLQRHDVDVLALQETKAREDQLPLMGLQAAGYDIAAAGTNQWNGVAIVSRVGLDDVTRRLRRHARVRRAARGRVAGDRRDLRRRTDLVALRAQRPQAGRPPLRLQARLAGPAPRGRRRVDGRPDGAGRRLEHLPDRRRRLRPGAVQELHARHAAGARGVPGVPRRRVRRGDPRLRAGLHLLGLLPAALRARPRAQDRLRPRHAVAGRTRHRRVHRPRGARRARARPTTPRSSSTSATEQPLSSAVWKRQVVDPGDGLRRRASSW